MKSSNQFEDQPVGGAAPFDVAPTASFDPRKIWQFVQRRWAAILSVGLLVMGLSFIQTLLTTPIYTSTAQILIDPRRERVFREQNVVSELQLDSSSIATETGIIKSFSVIRRVVQKLRLDEHPSFGNPPPKTTFLGWLSSFVKSPQLTIDKKTEDTSGKNVSSAPSQQDSSAQKPVTVQQLQSILILQSGLMVRRVGPTFFIDISYSHSDPQMASRIANGVAEAYLVDQLEARYQSSSRAASWLSERLTSVQKQLGQSEQLLAEHRSKYNLVKSQTGTLADQQASEINAQLVAARSQTVEKKSKYDQAQKILDGGAGIESVASVMDSPVIAGLRAQDADLARQEADQLTRYGPEHPTIVKIKAERGDIRRQVTREVSRVVQTLKTDYEFAQKREQSLDDSLKELFGTVGTDDQAIIRARELEREVEANKLVYDSMLTRFKEAEQQSAVHLGESRITEPALPSSNPSYPNRRSMLMISIALGLLSGIGAAAFMEFLENGFIDVEQVESTLKFPVLAVVPRLSARERMVDKKQLSIPEYAMAKPLSIFGEAIRNIRVSTQMSNIDNPPTVVLVGSTMPGEGKTTVLLTVAYSAASVGQRVLIVDCDLRHPSSTEYFQLKGAPGLTDLLIAQTTLEEVTRKTAIPNLFVISAGSPTRHPPDLLNSDRFRALLQSLRDSFDLVLIDAPPFSPVIDASLLSNQADKVVMIVSWRTTPRQAVLRAIQAVDNPRQKIAGIVINNSQAHSKPGFSPYDGYSSKQYDKYYTQ